MSHKAVFLDRDDTIIEDSGYINNPQQVRLIPGAAGALVDLHKMGYKIIVVSNQSGIARGIVTEQAITQIHERLEQLLAEQNTSLDKIYYCPYHPDGVIPKFRKDSDWRKPKPGMLFTAAKEMNISLTDSWMVGNDYKDVAAGKTAGCRTILIKSHTNMPVKQLSDPDADFEAINLKEAVNIVKREIMPKQNVEPVKPAVEPQQSQPPEIPAEQQKVRQNEFQPPRQVQKTETIETIEQKTQQSVSSSVSDNPGTRTEQLLEEIKLLLKSRHRQELYSDFSALKLFAGVLQIVVLFCLVVALWYKMSPTAQDSAVYTTLGFAIVFQLMALTLYIMHSEK
jgi:D-glycero-D-manno-heptose 1,7-bisphosphate phosphatase